ncbi:unnamed protein product [Phytophthora fragariaefolia]|uniref:Unnamed protein product n=1 Tax=Phytophthora fragariaefolia TaxID=1490495 RepID=A0A9W6Y348_9STRA|nr:unnamed protein product [Phytophthora fragariaefolia]
MSSRSILSAVVVPTTCSSDLLSEEDAVHVVETDEQLAIALQVGTDDQLSTTAPVDRLGVPVAPMGIDAEQQEVVPVSNSATSFGQSIRLGMIATVGAEPKRTKNYRGLVSSFNVSMPTTCHPNFQLVLSGGKSTPSPAMPRNLTAAPSFLPLCSVCPVCRADIRLVLPHTGTEEGLFWEWLGHSEPPLPASFKEGFKKAFRRLSDSALVMRTGSVCKSSAFGSLTARPYAGDTKNSPRLQRRASWTSAILHGKSVPKQSLQRQHEMCLIL